MNRCPYNHQDLVEANNVIKEAQLSLQALITGVYPIGAEVAVRIGRNVVRVAICGYGASYATSPGDLWGDNIATGRRRRFHFSQIITE